MSQPSVVGSQGQIWLCCLGKRDSVSLSLSPVNHRDSSQWWIALSSKCTESITLPCDAVVYSLNTFLSFFLKVLSSLRQVQRTTLTSSRPLSAWWTLSVKKWPTALRTTLLKPPEHLQPNSTTTLYRPSSLSAAASDAYAGRVSVRMCVRVRERDFCAVANLSKTKIHHQTPRPNCRLAKNFAEL